MKLSTLTSLIVAGLFTVSANAALYDRGNGMIYDDVLDITWLQDANYAKTTGYTSNRKGYMNWSEAITWADQLVYGGFDDWRLPTANLMSPVNPCSAYDGSCDVGYSNTIGELSYMYYIYLDNIGKFDTSGNKQSGFGMINDSFIDGDSGETLSFLNLQNFAYWYGEEFAADSSVAWDFHGSTGRQFYNDKSKNYYAWAVRDGDVSTVPVPGAAWLFGTAMLGLATITRRK